MADVDERAERRALFERAKALAAAGDHASARGLLAPLLDGDDFDAWFVLARVEVSAGDLPAAGHAIDRAIRITPKPKALELREAILARQADASGAPPAGFPRLPDDWDLAAELRLVDGLLKARDFEALIRLLDHAGSTASPLTRASVEARLSYHHQCFAEAIAAADRALALLDAPELSPQLRSEAIFELETVRARSLVTIGRADAVRFTPEITGPKPWSSTRRDLDLWWRSDPERGLRAADALLAGRRPPPRVLVLACMLPLELGDREGAAAKCRAIEARFQQEGLVLPPDYWLARARIAQADDDAPTALDATARFFEAHGLEPPTGFGATNFDFDRLGAAAPLAKLDEPPLVTVAVSAFNAERTLATAVGSLLDQTHARLQVIIVDDASTDGTRHVAEALAARDPRIEFLAQPANRGTYVARNAALARARGAFFTILDADDWAHPRRIERHVTLHRHRPHLLASASDWIRVTEDGRPLVRPSLGVFTHRNPGSPFFSLPFLTERLGGWEAIRIDADNDMWLRLLAAAGPERVERMRAPLTIGRHHGASLTRSGVGAQDRELYSPIRSAYRARALAWRRAGGSLRIDPDDPPRFPDLRLDAAPDA